MKVIVIEDEYRIRIGLANLIQKLNKNYNIVGEAENGVDGLKLVRNLSPDLIFTDIKMPRMSGLEMIDQLHKIGCFPPFIVLTGFSDFHYAQKALRLGAIDYLLKPIMVEDVRRVLENHFQQQNIPLAEVCEQYSSVINNMVITIKQDFGKDLGLGIFAEKYRLTPEYISGLFKKETGITYGAYIKKIRMEEAKRCLEQTNMKIFEIAFRVGYSDFGYFSKVFKSYTGFSPKDYVKHHTKK